MSWEKMRNPLIKEGEVIGTFDDTSGILDSILQAESQIKNCTYFYLRGFKNPSQESGVISD